MHAHLPDKVYHAPALETGHGIAVSPQAAHTLPSSDPVRAQRFMQSAERSIRKQVDKLNGKRPAHWIYAGCGTRGFLMTPLFSLFTPEELQAVHIDLQKDCVTSTQSVIDHLGFSEHAPHIIQANALTFQPQDHGIQMPFDGILSETMHHGLTDEPWPFIIRHLQRFLSSQGVIIPSRVEVSLGFGGKHPYQTQNFFKLDGALLTSRNHRIHPKQDEVTGWVRVPNRRGYTQTFLTTEVSLPHTQPLRGADSQLTLPTKIGGHVHPGERLEVNLTLGAPSNTVQVKAVRR